MSNPYTPSGRAFTRHAALMIIYPGAPAYASSFELAAGSYRVRWEGTAKSSSPRAVSFSITANGAVAKRHSQDRPAWDGGEGALMFATDDRVTLETAGVLAVAFEGDAWGTLRLT